MTTRELMIFKVKCKGRYRMTTNDDVKSVSIIKKDGVVQAKVIGNIGEVIYNYDMSIANIMGGKMKGKFKDHYYNPYDAGSYDNYLFYVCVEDENWYSAYLDCVFSTSEKCAKLEKYDREKVEICNFIFNPVIRCQDINELKGE